MKEAWCLASSRSDLSGSQIKAAYGRRFTVEETFRDVKNPRLGLGLKQTVVRRNDRRDMLFLLAVLSHTLLTLLGQAGSELGMSAISGPPRPEESPSSARGCSCGTCCRRCARTGSQR